MAGNEPVSCFGDMREKGRVRVPVRSAIAPWGLPGAGGFVPRGHRAIGFSDMQLSFEIFSFAIQEALGKPLVLKRQIIDSIKRDAGVARRGSRNGLKVQSPSPWPRV